MAPWRRVITKMACNGTIRRNLWFTATVVAHQFRQGHVSGIKEDHPGGFHRRWSGSDGVSPSRSSLAYSSLLLLHQGCPTPSEMVAAGANLRVR
jgi:hypothetical protein